MVANVWTDYAEGIGSGKTVSFDGLGQLHIDSEKGQLVVEKVSDKLNYLVCVCAPREGGCARSSRHQEPYRASVGAR